MTTCPTCSAVSHGNITCQTCRDEWRRYNVSRGWPTGVIDRLDAIGMEMVPPLGPDAVQAFMARLEQLNGEA